MRRLLGLSALAVLGTVLARARRRGEHGRHRHSSAGAQPPNLTSTPSAAHRDLDLLFAQLRDLHEIAGDPDRAESEDVIYDFSIRWGALLSGRLQRLDYYYRRGELAPDERERYEELARRFEQSQPIIDRLRLPRPTTGLPN